MSHTALYNFIDDELSLNYHMMNTDYSAQQDTCAHICGK